MELFEGAPIEKMNVPEYVPVAGTGDPIRRRSVAVASRPTPLPRLRPNLVFPQFPQPLEQNLLFDVSQVVLHAGLAASPLQQILGATTSFHDGSDFVGGENSSIAEVFERGDHAFEDGLDLFRHYGGDVVLSMVLLVTDRGGTKYLREPWKVGWRSEPGARWHRDRQIGTLDVSH